MAPPFDCGRLSFLVSACSFWLLVAAFARMQGRGEVNGK